MYIYIGIYGKELMYPNIWAMPYENAQFDQGLHCPFTESLATIEYIDAQQKSFPTGSGVEDQISEITVFKFYYPMPES